MDRKARLAAAVSINKGKACDAAAPRSPGVTRGSPSSARALRARSAFHGADRAAGRTFTVLPDGGRMDMTLRLAKTPKTGCRELTITSPTVSEELAHDAAIHRIFPVA